jgi:hypothetical protein
VNAPRKSAPRSAPKEEEVDEETPAVEAEQEQAAPATLTLVRFVPTNHSGTVSTGSGASYTLSPGVAVKMTSADAAALAEQGLGFITEG